MIFRDVGGPGLALRPILRISGIIVILGALPTGKSRPFLGQNAATKTFFAVLYFTVFLNGFCYWIFVILGSGGSISAPFCVLCWEPWASEKSLKSVYLPCISEGWPLPGGGFFAGLDCGCVLMLSFCSFL